MAIIAALRAEESVVNDVTMSAEARIRRKEYWGASDLAEGYASDSGEDDAGEGEDAAEILKEILPYIEMAREAYQDTSMSERIDMVAKSQLVRSDRKDTEVHVCLLKDDSVVFAFRGTETADLGSFIKDFLTDIRATQDMVQLYAGNGPPVYTCPPEIRVHSGFQAALRDVTNGKGGTTLMHALRELGVDAGNVRRVVCVGHSLGGALATVCAKWCRQVAFPRAEIGCVTIGSPRVGNAAFVADFDSQVVSPGVISYRVVNKRDVVPFLPGLLYPYKHVPRAIYLWEDEEGHTRATLGGSGPTFFDVLHGHHAANSYVASINAVLEAAFPASKNQR